MSASFYTQLQFDFFSLLAVRKLFSWYVFLSFIFSTLSAEYAATVEFLLITQNVLGLQMSLHCYKANPVHYILSKDHFLRFLQHQHEVNRQKMGIIQCRTLSAIRFFKTPLLLKLHFMPGSCGDASLFPKNVCLQGQLVGINASVLYNYAVVMLNFMDPLNNRTNYTEDWTFNRYEE